MALWHLNVGQGWILNDIKLFDWKQDLWNEWIFYANFEEGSLLRRFYKFMKLWIQISRMLVF